MAGLMQRSIDRSKAQGSYTGQLSPEQMQLGLMLGASMLPGTGIAELPEAGEDFQAAWDAFQKGDLTEGGMSAIYGLLGGVDAASDGLMMAGTVLPPLAAVGAGMKALAKAGKATRDAARWAPFSKTKLNKTVEEMNEGLEVLPRAGAKAETADLTPEDLYGHTLTNFVGDRSNVGTVTKIGGQELDAPIELHGGKKYMLGDSGVWASAEQHAKPFHRIAQEAPTDTLGIMTPMGGNSGDFSHMMLDVFTRDLDFEKITKKQAKVIDTRIRKGVGVDARPSFPGIRSEGIRDHLHANAADRKAVIQMLAKREHADKLGLDVAEARHAMTDPDFLMRPNEAAGVDPLLGAAVAKIDPNQGLMATADLPNPHPTYDTAVPGDYVGGLMQQLPRSLMFPDWYQARRAGNLPMGADRRAFDTTKLAQGADQQWLDNAMMYLHRLHNGGP